MEKLQYQGDVKNGYKQHKVALCYCRVSKISFFRTTNQNSKLCYNKFGLFLMMALNMNVRIVLLLGRDERTQISYENLVKKLPYRFAEPDTLFLAGILRFEQSENIITFQDLMRLDKKLDGDVSQEEIVIPSERMGLEDIVQKPIDKLRIHFISHGREDAIGALTIKEARQQNLWVAGGSLRLPS